MSRLCFFPCECGIRYKVVYEPQERRTATHCACGKTLSVPGKILEIHSRRSVEGQDVWTREKLSGNMAEEKLAEKR